MPLLQPVSGSNAKFKEIGDTYTGTLIKISEEQQATVYDGVRGVPTNEPDFWDKETKQRPKMQIYVLLECQRDGVPAHFDYPDDGNVKIWATVEAKHASMYAALIDGGLGKADRLGGQLTVQYVGTDPESRNPQNPRRMYAASYVEPPLLGGPTGQQTPTVQQPVQQAPPAAQVPQAGQIPAQPPAGSGVDADTWARMPAATQQAIIAGLQQQTGGQPPY
ncbi:hypothetical protein FK529_05665 [Tsukamurella asaccharolytica]|uniref:Uncharacterized protein n=1 Tax=Tsukamurella asaccharolytica TaxID=2592067 RepID=A0A5C5RD04_9ACTN|nr:hypothetical protein [Tsukamurella asaccharolytica]TWS20810.1 hypothetical protein FK529_05665 [Tsukamurella asaccharolytica]